MPEDTKQASVTPDAVASKIRSEYNHASSRPEIKHMEALQKIISDCQAQHIQLNTFLSAIAQFIYRQLNINSLSIGIWDPAEGKYRYVAHAGLRGQAMETLSNVTYTKHDFLDPKKYPFFNISRYTKLFLAENNPYTPGEEGSYNRPLMLTQRRSTPDDTIEGDYLDIMILDERDEIKGWIEISGTKLGKLPDASTIHWLELVGSIIGLVLTAKNITMR